MTNYQQTVARCDAAEARQTATVARLAPNTSAHALAQDTLAAMRHAKKVFVLSQRRRYLNDAITRLDRWKQGRTTSRH